MATGWRILDLTETSGSFDVERGAVVITTAAGVVERVPASDISLVLLGTGVKFTSGVLHRLAGHDVVMMLCDWRGVPQAVSLPWAEHSRIAARQIAQAEVSAELKAEAWGRVVRAKVHGQAATLRSVKPKYAPRLEEFAEQVKPGDTSNVEASAARYYWPLLWGKNFVRDLDGGDRINALLNYGYGILRGHGIRAVLAAGLVPALGVGHSHRANPFNLVADLMEPFRPVVDSAVLNLPPYSSLKKVETKKLLAVAMEVPFGDSGLSALAEFGVLAQRYGRFVQGESDAFTVNAWTGPGG